MKKLTSANNSFLHFLSSCHKEQRKAILQTTTDDQLKLLVEIVLNILRGVIPTSTRTRNLLRSNKSNIRKVVDDSISKTLRRKRLIKISSEIPVILLSFLILVTKRKYENLLKRVEEFNNRKEEHDEVITTTTIVENGTAKLPDKHTIIEQEHQLNSSTNNHQVDSRTQTANDEQIGGVSQSFVV